MTKTISVITAFLLAGSLSGCAGGALMALSAAGGAVGIAKNVFDIDLDIHTLLGQNKPAQPIPAAQIATHPQYMVVTPQRN